MGGEELKEIRGRGAVRPGHRGLRGVWSGQLDKAGGGAAYGPYEGRTYRTWQNKQKPAGIKNQGWKKTSILEEIEWETAWGKNFLKNCPHPQLFPKPLFCFPLVTELLRGVTLTLIVLLGPGRTLVPTATINPPAPGSNAAQYWYLWSELRVCGYKHQEGPGQRGCWSAHHPGHRKAGGSIPSQGTSLGYGSIPSQSACVRNGSVSRCPPTPSSP